jgi:uncharacterized LabA/DUF88 family protein
LIKSGEQTLYILVDFNNLDKPTFGMSLNDIVDCIIYSIVTHMLPEDLALCGRVNIRLYDGWYEDDALTIKASDLIADCPTSPQLFSFRDEHQRYNWHVSVEIAFSLLSIPTVHIMHTYRRRQRLKGIRVVDPVSVGCDPTRCRILGIERLIKKEKCPDCGTPANLIIWREEQKLVDVMLATDMMTLALMPDIQICLVSSDDDFWPALFHISCNHKRIYHMQSTPGRSLNDLYLRHNQESYIEILIE